MIQKIIDIFKILSHPYGGVSFFKNNAKSISSFKIISIVRNHIKTLNTIIDIGANKGQFAFASTRFFPMANIYSFEPVPESFSKLTINCSDTPFIHPFNLALGDTNGIINFFQNSHSHASSALPTSSFQKREIPKTSESTKIQVPVRRLDDIAKELPHLKHPILLKLDVQGYEKHVLEGAGEFIKVVDYLLFEASFVPMYEGEPLFDEMHSYVKALGFSLIGPVGSLQTSNNRIVQMDMLYQRNKS